MSTETESQVAEQAVVQAPGRIMPWMIITAALLFGGIGLFVGGVILYGNLHQDTVAKGLLVGDVPVGGMSAEDTSTFVASMVDKLLTTPMEITAETSSGSIRFSIEPVSLVGADGTARELVSFDEEEIITTLLAYGKEGNRFTTGWNLLRIRFEQPQIVLSEHVVVDTNSIQDIMEQQLRMYSTPAVDANIRITNTRPISVAITDSSEGVSYTYAHTIDAIALAYETLSIPTVSLDPVVVYPDIVAADLQAVTSTIESVLTQFPVTLTYINTSTRSDETWTIYPERAAELIEPKRSDHIYIGLRTDAFLAYLDTIVAPVVEVEAKNARFSMEAGRVSEFQGAQNGVAIATSTMVDALNDMIVAMNMPDAGVSTTLPVQTIVAEPEVATSDVNDLGITELLGVGISDFSGSPSNRIGNIRNAVNKLNGLIVAPGEEFSTIEHTKPYTIAGGYLPELVIKGDSIEPEIGGGLCQIGTTLFRMAMNSGLEITERRNHSLVVGYYNDLENGLPGTDATIYDPAPDFKFKNDTEHYILIEADMNVSTGLLTFSLWGTSDGRTAEYSRPQVLEWYSPGEARYIETTNLEPGVTECQHAYRGAYTSFTYTRELPGMEEPEETVYTSRYRALPKICLIGVDPNAGKDCVDQPDGSTVCMDQSTPTTSSTLPTA